MIIPVILGADLNAYSVARSFHEKYDVKSFAFAKEELGPIKFSRIITYIRISNRFEDEQLNQFLISFADDQGADYYLIPCTDEYVEYVARNVITLSGRYICRTVSHNLLSALTSKADFAMICGKYNLPIPQTRSLTEGEFRSSGLPQMSYPIAIKPSVSAEYWRHPFRGMKKVYYASSAREAYLIAEKIYGAQYDGELVFQEYIPGGDDKMRVLTTFSHNGKVVSVCYGHVILEEHTPKGLGNHVAIITEPMPDELLPAITMLDDLKYDGFANFDIIFDSRSNTLKFLELNARQGRSNYYMTAAGISIAGLIVSPPGSNKRGYDYNNIYWHTVPNRVVMKYANKNEMAEIRRARADHCEYDPLLYKYDLLSPRRAAYVIAHNLKYYDKYRKYP